jgi:integrative and conjugative element protein (TIGR02256 family)
MMHSSTLWLSRDVLSALVEEADRMAPLETGGVLLGYRPEGDEPVVTDAIGPGPNAIHKRYRFVPDHDYQIHEIDRLYRDSGRLLEYLGDWHTHPGGLAELSTSDLAAIRAIATEKEARVPRPVMLVLAPGPDWALHAWRGTMTGRTRLWRRLVTVRLKVHVFDGDVMREDTGGDPD